MNTGRLRIILASVALLMLVGCNNSATQTQRAEEAVNRGDPPTTVDRVKAANAFRNTCKAAGGNWKLPEMRCAMTASMCAQPGEWDEAIGCVFPSIPVTNCADMQHQGMQVVGDVCAITDLSLEQFEQLGLGGEN